MLAGLLILIILLVGCQLPPAQPAPISNITPTIVPNNISAVNNTNIINMTNTTIEPTIKPVETKLAVYILHNSGRGSFVITTENKSILVNSPGGSDGLRLLKIMKNLGINHLDYFILTNDEEGNIEGAPTMILRFNSNHTINSGIPSLKKEYKEYLSLSPNISITPNDYSFAFGDSIINLIVPYDDGQSLTNDTTISLKINYGDQKILITTDCRVDCESRISNIDSDILISNGNCDSLTYGFLKQVSPNLVIFSANPCPEVLSRVKNLDYETLMVTDGDILIAINGTNYEHRSFQ